jgi:hypothetical protein
MLNKIMGENPMQNRCCFRTLTAILLLAPSGCGLKEYEERMEKQRKQAKAFDYNESFLDQPIEAPPQVDNKPAWRFDVFLRLPRGYLPAPRPTRYTYETVTLYRYAFPGKSQEKPKDEKAKQDNSPNPDNSVQNIFVGTSSESISSDKLRAYALGALKKYISQEIGEHNFEPPTTKLTRISLDMGADNDAIEFDRLNFDGPFDLQFQLYIDTRSKIALIFQTPRDAAAGFATALEACLKSLDVSEEAPLKRSQYMNSRKAKK